MYSHLEPKRRAALILGSSIRSAKCLIGNATSANRFIETFTQDDIDLINEIHLNAIERARAKYDETIRAENTTIPATQVGSGSSTEHREYSGK